MTLLHARPAEQTQAREAILDGALAGFVEELRLVDCADLMGYVRLRQFANIEDLVMSSCELLFEPRTLTFGWGAELGLSWREPPSLALDMEFSAEGVTVFFLLRLQGHDHRSEIRFIAFDGPDPDPSANTARLENAVFSAMARKPDGQPQASLR